MIEWEVLYTINPMLIATYSSKHYTWERPRDRPNLFFYSLDLHLTLPLSLTRLRCRAYHYGLRLAKGRRPNLFSLTTTPTTV